MGFDIECVIDIHTYPGEYFCPVCRTLVYPNEAVQSQCTHLYCKPCLSHIANGSRACPYDGYLVTESESKLLRESDKELAEKIGSVKVHCLFFRSGCTWEGTLSECSSHCSACPFGNSPVICNRCGVQIVHRQVHDHVQFCPGAYGVQQAVGVASSITTSGNTTGEVNQTAGQPALVLQPAQNSLNATGILLPWQNASPAVKPTSDTPTMAPVAVATPDQWYQLQYQQYYLQYVGYDPYQQPSQQYYSLQTQSIQQYPQHPVQFQVEQQSHVYSQAQTQTQAQNQTQTQTQAQNQTQIHTQGQTQIQTQAQTQIQTQQPTHIMQAPQQPLQPQSQTQIKPQSQLQQLPQTQLQVQVPPQGQAHPQAPLQALTPNYQVNLQPQSHPPMRPVAQITPHTLSAPPHSQFVQPLAFSQPADIRSHSQQPQMPQYQKAHVQMNNLPASQVHLQPQHQPNTQSSNQTHSQHLSLQPYYNPSIPHANQSTDPTALAQALQPLPSVSSNHSYQQPQPAQKMHSGVTQQPQVQSYQPSGSLHPVHGQLPQQPALLLPPLSHGSMPQGKSSVLPPQNQPGFLSAEHQQVPTHGQQPINPLQTRPAMQPSQQALPQSYTQQQHFVTPFRSQVHQQGHVPPQSSMQPQTCPSGLPQHQSENYVLRPMIPSQGMSQQTCSYSSAGFDPQFHSGSAQFVPTQTSMNQKSANSTVFEQNSTTQETASSLKRTLERGRGGESMGEDVVSGQNEATKDVGNVANSDLHNSAVKHVRGDQKVLPGQVSHGNSFGAGVAEDTRTFAHSNVKQADGDNQKMKLSSVGVAGPQSHVSREQNPAAEVQGNLPHPSNSINQTEGNIPGYFGSTAERFESQSNFQGTASMAVANQHRMTGRSPPLFEGQFGSKLAVSNSEVAISKKQYWERGPLIKDHASDPSLLRMKGETVPDSSALGSQDEKVKTVTREHLTILPRDQTRSLDQASWALDKTTQRPTYDTGMTDSRASGSHPRFLPHPTSGGNNRTNVFVPGPEFGQHHMKQLTRPSPDRKHHIPSPHGFGGLSSYPRTTSAFDDGNSREGLRFGEGSRPSNHSSDPFVNPLRDGRFPPMFGNVRREDIDGPDNPRFGEQMAPGLRRNQFGSNNIFEPDGQDHSMKGKFSGPGHLPGNFNITGPGGIPGHVHAGEFGGPVNFPRFPLTESVRRDRLANPHFGEPTLINNSVPGGTIFAVGMHAFDQSRKRNPASVGWCRICKVDCQTVEGLQLHSQRREHQKMSMDMVANIKLQNKRQRSSAGYMAHEGVNRSRKTGIAGRVSNH